ncbi:interactor of HORMAD1 protein 1 isoform X2 [Hippoglossus hippoglossus]|uniref:interactor of HORMAD1 protein 1 isoform X2 n=1 Tax=Hippoglossus hippoglossus TaxID=8267 RepID=UPI00148C1DEB|nr:interactor of HORMAD1 protein 1 isoform X2 [Hippoglossus hippoglossus]
MAGDLNSRCVFPAVTNTYESYHEHKRNAEYSGWNQKTMNRNVSTSGYSSFTDSQLFFGSQLWPDNSQSMSQEINLSSSSQEASDPKFASTYHTKPLLFGDAKGKTRALGILDKFEEERKKTKENNVSELLAKESQHTRETLNNIQQLVAGTERNMAVVQTVLENFDNFASILHNNMIGLQNDISQYSEILVTKLNSHNEVMTKLEDSVKKSADTTAELGSNLQILKSSLESLREEQERERNLLAEALKLLSTLVSEHSAKPGPQRVMDRSIQTLPELEQSASSILQNKALKGTALTCTPHNLEHKQVEVPPQDHSCSIGKRKSRSQRKRTKKAPTLSQRSKRKVSDENSPSLINCKKVQKLLSPRSKRCDLKRRISRDNTDCLSVLCREKRTSKAAGCLLTPLSCWSQDSNSPACLVGIEPILEKLSAETKTATPVNGFWQLFGIDCDSDFGF